MKKEATFYAQSNRELMSLIFFRLQLPQTDSNSWSTNFPTLLSWEVHIFSNGMQIFERFFVHGVELLRYTTAVFENIGAPKEARSPLFPRLLFLVKMRVWDNHVVVGCKRHTILWPFLRLDTPLSL